MPEEKNTAAKKDYGYVKKSFMYEGKRYYVRGKSERDAQKKLVALQVELKTSGKKLNGKMTVKAWSEKWLEVYVDHKKATAKSIEMYHQKLKTTILPEIGSMRMEDVRDTHLQELLNKANSSYSHAQKVRIVLHAMFKRAAKSHIIPYDPSEDLELPDAPKGKRRSITDQERAMILDTAKVHHAGPFVLLMLYCGIRPNEAIALQWKDLDFKSALLHVEKALESGNNKHIKKPKTDAGIRCIEMPRELMEALLPLRKGPFDPVLLQPRGKKRHTESSIHDAWNNFLRVMDIRNGAEVYRSQIVKSVLADDLVPYCLRHTFCTDLQRADVPLNVAKYLMGHEDVSTTGNIYTDTTPDVIRLAGAKMRKFYASGCKNVSTVSDDEANRIADEIA